MKPEKEKLFRALRHLWQIYARIIDRSTAFKRDYKREAKGQHRLTLEAELTLILTSLVHDQPLRIHYRDHDLSGEWAGYRDCHIKPDLLLIYRKINLNILRLVRLGSHSQLFS